MLCHLHCIRPSYPISERTGAEKQIAQSVTRHQNFALVPQRSNGKYLSWYISLMAKARLRELKTRYKERHHIIPRSLGGSDLPDNLVDLTYREHWAKILICSGASFSHANCSRETVEPQDRPLDRSCILHLPMAGNSTICW
jgi:hypothetical protein